MILDREHWQAIDAILDEVLDLPREQQQEAILTRCNGDRELFANVMEVIDRAYRSDDFLERNALEIANTLFQELSQPRLSSQVDGLRGFRIGAFVLDCEIGRGGMGVVYKAHRVEGDFKQTVAIKLMLYTSVAAEERFRREQQVLAALTQPNITKLYDGGVTEEGVPYLVMEFIEGIPITDYCRENGLNLTERLQLLDQVLEALKYSHKNLVVHRDIKPSNILVTANGQVKLLDFSIAKLLDNSLDFAQTATHFHLFTPGFSAPEQLLNKPVTVVTDIYQIGLLYYLLLTGHPSFTLDANSLPELIAKVCQQEVIKPSVMAQSSSTLEQATVQPSDWSRQLQGDLDAIILKMLRKEAVARYQSIESVQIDLYAYRHHLPVIARQAALSYQTGKFVRRHWKSLSLACIVLFALGGYTLTITEQNKRIIAAFDKAETEQRKTEQVAKFLAEIFEAADPNEGGLAGITARDLLEQAGTRINDELQDAPEIRAALLNIFGVIYFRQQDYKEADKLLSGLLRDENAVRRLDAHLLAESKLRLAQQKMGLGDYRTAKSLVEESLALQEQDESSVDNAKRLLLGQTYAFGGLIDLRMKNREQALPVIHRSIDVLSEMGPEGDDMRAFALNILADDQYRNNQLSAAIANMYEVIALKKRARISKQTEIARIQIGLAYMLLDLDRLDQAKAVIAEAIAVITNLLPIDHPYQLIGHTAEAKLQQRLGNFAQAASSLNVSCLATDAQAVNFPIINCRTLYAEILIDQHKLDLAEAVLADLESSLRARGAEDFSLARIQSLRGRIALLHNRPDIALEFFNLAMDLMNNDPGYTHVIRRDKAAAFMLLKRHSEAARELAELLTHLVARYDSQHSQTLITCALFDRLQEENDLIEDTVLEKSCTQEHKVNLPAYLTRIMSTPS